jgi:3-hydroxybutyryl-CoA dehydrogenase
MGVGVAQCLAQAGHPVTVADPDPPALAAGAGRLGDGLRLATLLGRADPVPDTAARVRWVRSLDELGAPGFVVECGPERVETKQAIFAALDAVCPASTILASCTSAIPIARLGDRTGRPDRVLGTHFMNPAPLKDTVEVVRAAGTSDETVRRTVELLAGIGKHAVVVRDAPGFVANRVLMLMINEAAAVVAEGTADAATVDRIFQDCFGHPTGPLGTADLIGLDSVLDTLLVLLDQTGDERFRPRPLLGELVRSGRLGRKSGHGFHRYLR